MYSRRFLSLIALAAIATLALLLVTGCSHDHPTMPVNKSTEASKAGGNDFTCITGERDYPFIYSQITNGYWVYTYSSKTGQVIDSSRYGHDAPFEDARYSKDGHYACYTGGSNWISGTPEATWVTDYRTGDTISILYGVWGHHLSVSSDDRYLLVTDNKTLRLMEIPSLRIVYELENWHAWSAGAIHPQKNVAYVPGVNDDSLLIIDFSNFPIRTRKVVLRGLDGIRVFGRAAAVSADGRILILKVARFTGPYYGYIQFLDSETFKLLKQYRPNLSGPIVHPDGERLFFWDCIHFDLGNPASVWVFSLKTFEARQIYGGYIFSDCGPSFFNPGPGDDDNGMAITPDGKYAFIINGGEGLGYGPIQKMDLRTYKIVDQICPPGYNARLIRMYPHEIKQGVDHVPESF